MKDHQALSIAFYGPVPGSGVTSLVAHLFSQLGSLQQGRAALVDCDLEFPTLHAFFRAVGCEEHDISVLMPRISRSFCILCKACATACVFGAIDLQKSMSYIRLDEDSCRACGACLNSCRHAAITEHEKVIGRARRLGLGGQCDILEMELLAGDFFAIKAIQSLRRLAADYDLVFTDARGGLDYLSLEAMHDADLVVVVIDLPFFSPGPYAQVMGYLLQAGKELVVVVNRTDAVPDDIAIFCAGLGVTILGCVPYHPDIPRRAVRGGLLTDAASGGDAVYRAMLADLLRHAGKEGLSQ